MANSGTGYGNTVKFAVLWQTDGNLLGKMYANGCFWEAEKEVAGGVAGGFCSGVVGCEE